jgi:peptidoglycan/LPS O-acetylase OafA/YrhL
MNNLRQLHIIRGFAAFYVALGHSKVVLWSGARSYLDKYPRSDWNLADYFLFALDLASSSAQEFVIIFFALSGFFIAYSFDKNKWTFKDFFVNRFVRIYPPYLFAVIFSILVMLIISMYSPELVNGSFFSPINQRMTASFQEMNWQTGLLSLFFIKNQDYIAGNFSFWSLLPEWIFYLMIPFVIRFKWFPLTLFLILFGINILLGLEFSSDFFKFLFEYGFYFFLGASFYDFLEKRSIEKINFSPWIGYFVLILLLFGTIASGIVDMKPWSHIIACFFTLISIVVLLKYPIPSSIFYRIGIFLGDVSYTLYIVHLPVYYLIYSVLYQLTGQTVFYERYYWGSIPIVLLFSYIMFLAIEKPTLVYISHLKNKK